MNLGHVDNYLQIIQVELMLSCKDKMKMECTTLRVKGAYIFLKSLLCKDKDLSLGPQVPKIS